MAANSAVSLQYDGSFFAINNRDGVNSAVRSDLNIIFNNDPMFRIEVGENSYIYVFPHYLIADKLAYPAPLS